MDAWNSLSDDVVCEPSVPVFKYCLKHFSFWWAKVLLVSFSLHFNVFYILFPARCKVLLATHPLVVTVFIIVLYSTAFLLLLINKFLLCCPESAQLFLHSKATRSRMTGRMSDWCWDHPFHAFNKNNNKSTFISCHMVVTSKVVKMQIKVKETKN